MLVRILQFVLVIFGFLFIVVAVFTLRITPAQAGAGFFSSIVLHLKTLLYLFVGFLCLFGAYRLGKGRNKKSSQPPSS